MPRRPGVAIELRDLTAAADLLEALRGTPPATKADALRRRQLAARLERALFTRLVTPQAH